MSNSTIFLKSGFINVPLQNGMRRYVGQLQRVVLKFCKNHGSSRGMREFIETDLVDFAKNNPGIVVYLKPRRHRTAVMKAEYLNGETQWLSCRNFTREEVYKWLELFKKQQKVHEGTRIRKLWHTENPSIQGPWTPFTFRDPKLNLVTFPIELSKCENISFAQDELVELFKKQKIQESEIVTASN
ncbi:39S ribosomal protein L43, mitochondrial [Diorhabda sublineata]|uniref:39S ribosomal protein L43, mitochondrial n=1 Tax=Diorhabda sublineata TaxID=1163346 RepID=UPI0024E10196|nr:39S ribosomal protein L43, mitochondrial [Diorhabda sublineata]